MKHLYYSLFIALLFPPCQNRTFINHSGEKGELKKINGVNLWVTLLGTGDPLFLIAGGPGSSHVSLHNFDSLKDSNTLVFIDFYGRGQSDTATDSKSYTIDNDVEAVEGVRKALGFERINILGQSFGSIIGQKYAIKYEPHVEHLIIANGFYSGKMFQAGLDNMNKIYLKDTSLGWERLYYYDTANKKNKYNDPNYPNDWNDKVYYQFLGDRADVKVSDDFLMFEDTAKLKNLKLPILILAGRHDRISLPELSIKFKEYCTQASFVMLEKSGHFPEREQPEKVIAIIREFLKK